MKNLTTITNTIQNFKKINEFENIKNNIIPWLTGPLCDYLTPFEFIIIYLATTEHYYLCQTTLDNNLICLDILNNENELKQLVKKQKNNTYIINFSNGQLKFNDSNSNEIHISPYMKDKFFRVGN